ncbi:ribonucleoside triphosphate reductase [Candidatus Jorgensenbacteria bacterium RIFCSPLOWO2_01_FULL_45_25b]|uniref:Ribonucleoside triphosphate reductase n=1 Tax=Candidatus Jorgensenbacteria bacterium RIFCSPLOWO2_01_FULL_45_25b TaxID=1798471 RepID=A0A1F6BYZ2_9BACT|nr:MAG: ribonucleoside triphosphate reductase [Candidatus Jorgensenbacteria bacterium RIFCSPLOWO2_01_FULL_45_25b]
MFTKIIKRDGREVRFEKEKITAAIAKAGTATGEFRESIAEKLTDRVLAYLESKLEGKMPHVEEIQDAVERILMCSRFKQTAKAYILYREQHAEMRAFATMMSLGLVDNYLEKLDWQVKENSNMGYSLQGLNNYISSEVSKTYWLNKIYPGEVRQAYEKGDLHLHDLGTLAVYCVGWDLMDLLTEGFRGVSDKIESSPPKHFRTALGQAVNFMYTLQGEAAGAIAFSNFDTLLAPFIRYDNLSYEEVKQSLQEFVFNMNVPTRVGFQTPFSNITLDLTPSPNFKDQSVIIGGKPKNETYADFQVEMDMFNNAFFDVMGEGDAAGRVFTFPIPTVNVTRDFNWENPNLQGLWNITAKYGIPYFSNFVSSDLKPEDTRSMCCRLRLNLEELDRRGGGLFGANALTGSVGVVTINLPRLAYRAKSTEGDVSAHKKDFFEKLAVQMDIAKESLEIKRKMLERFTDANLYPYTKFYLKKIKETYGEYWKNHFSTIGLVGMNEAVLNLFGEDIGTEEGQKFAAETLDYMRNRLVDYQKETGNLYNLEATPAEGTAYRLALKDKKLYPDIIVANEKEFRAGAQPFYTNSSHLPVNYTDDVVETLNIQDNLQTKYTGGTVIHLFLGEQINDTRSVPSLIKKICENYKLPYFTLTPTFSICREHGYLTGEHFLCETCSKECEVYSRIVGYLRPVSQWNAGKRSEYALRKMYNPQKNLSEKTVEQISVVYS